MGCILFLEQTSHNFAKAKKVNFAFETEHDLENETEDYLNNVKNSHNETLTATLIFSKNHKKQGCTSTI